jgi:hypothetical protein
MASFGLICAGASSEAFTRELCQTCHDHYAQDIVLLVGVHPSSGTAKETVTMLRNIGINAVTVERQNTAVTDIFALTTLLLAFNDINVPIPDLLILVLDEQYIADPDLITQSWQVVSDFQKNSHRTEIVVVYFTPGNRYTNRLDQIKGLLPQSGVSNAPLVRALLISESASLRTRFGNGYRRILARHLAILLVSETSSTVSVSFLQQMHRIKTPFIGFALDEVETPQIGEWATTLRGRLAQNAVKDIAQSLIAALVALLNMNPPQTSFDEIRPGARKNAAAMLAVNIFAPLLPRDDRAALDNEVISMLDAFGVDAQGMVAPKAHYQQSPATIQDIQVFPCSFWELVKANSVLNRIPAADRLVSLQSHEQRCQVLVFFGIEAPHTPYTP